MSEEPEVEAVRQLMALAQKYGLAELKVEEAGLKVTLRAAQPPDGLAEPATNGGRYLWQPPVWNEPAAENAAPTRPETAYPLLAPLTGTFYRANSPQAPPLVELGQTVEEGYVVGLIEAMKVFSEVAADRPGVVIEVLVQNGQIVHHGDVLFYIDPS